jgi:hypothetical protein
MQQDSSDALAIGLGVTGLIITAIFLTIMWIYYKSNKEFHSGVLFTQRIIIKSIIGTLIILVLFGISIGVVKLKN